MFRPLLFLSLSLLLAAVPATAEAKSYKGKTSQRRVVTVRTGADGVVNHARLSWHAPCRGNVRYNGVTTFRPPLDVATGDSIQDGGTYRVSVKGGFRARITGTLAGQRDG